MLPQTTMQQHINRVHELADRLASIGLPVSDEDILLVLLTSVPSTYDNVVVALETKSTALTIDLVTSALLNEERRQSGGLDQPDPSSALVAHSKSRSKQGSTNTVCHLCQKPGHFVAQCPILPAVAAALEKQVEDPPVHTNVTEASEWAGLMAANSTSGHWGDSDSHVF
jgi:hypothetical protein